MARSDRYAAKAGAWADFRLASLTDQATAVATLATTINTPWAHFQADLAAARRDWWSGVKPDYLAWVADVNQEYEDYQAAAAGAYVTKLGNVTAASTARWTSIAGLRETCVIAEAGAHETYFQAMAGHRETYLVAAAQAERDFFRRYSAARSAISSGVGSTARLQRRFFLAFMTHLLCVR